MKIKRSLPVLLLSASLMCLAPMALTACQSDTGTHMTNQNMSLSVTASQSVINRGEVVTFVVHDSGTLGKDVDIKWHSTGGNLDVSDNSRVAHVKFDKTGTYSVTAEFWVDGSKYQTATKVVTVNSIQ